LPPCWSPAHTFSLGAEAHEIEAPFHVLSKHSLSPANHKRTWHSPRTMGSGVLLLAGRHASGQFYYTFCRAGSRARPRPPKRPGAWVEGTSIGITPVQRLAYLATPAGLIYVALPIAFMATPIVVNQPQRQSSMAWLGVVAESLRELGRARSILWARTSRPPL
jgi:hypothetical protein